MHGEREVGEIADEGGRDVFCASEVVREYLPKFLSQGILVSVSEAKASS